MDESAPVFRPAKITDRFLAYLVDLAPFFAGYAASLYYLLLTRRLEGPAGLRQVLAAWIALYLLYQAAGNAAGGTPGKRLFGLRVVRLDGTPLGALRGVVRAAGYVLSTPLCNLGFLWAVFQADSRAWHDLLAGSAVVEAREKSPSAAFRNAVAALLLLCLILGGNAWLYLVRPTPEDREAVRKAEEGLRVFADIEEQWKRSKGGYTDQLQDLAEASGDVGEFKEAMGKIFDTDGFVLLANKNAYSISARALDRHRTEVMVAGP